jgi:hypothetical protein
MTSERSITSLAHHNNVLSSLIEQKTRKHGQEGQKCYLPPGTVCEADHSQSERPITSLPGVTPRPSHEGISNNSSKNSETCLRRNTISGTCWQTFLGRGRSTFGKETKYTIKRGPERTSMLFPYICNPQEGIYILKPLRNNDSEIWSKVAY